ncbi:MAG TPA: DinB family protein [Chitinophagaceae bacterium]|nr:DinB family protein [Chitinophagaceae bacterium]
MKEELLPEFINTATTFIDENTARLKTCLSELDEADIWRRPNKNSNSVGNLILHLSGNIRQWIISSLGYAEDTRQRDSEFAATDGYTKSELAEKLFSIVEEAKKIINKMTPKELLTKRKVQGYLYSGIAIILHVTEHYSYHTGQVIFWTKLLKDKDLGFYTDSNLNDRNEI